jgi:hypothetical protein
MVFKMKNYLNSIKQDKNMNKKEVIMVILLIILILIPVYLITRPVEKIPDKESSAGPHYSEYPGDWIEPENESIEDGAININVAEATEEQSEYVLSHQRYVDFDGSIKAIYYEGSYKGEYFKSAYEDSEGNVKIATGTKIDPYDGILESFALLKKEDGKFVLYLFIDEDWKKESNSDINIIWGNDLRNNEIMNSRKYDFSKEQNGVYFDKVTDNLEFLTEQTTVTGGLFLGELSFEDFKNDKFENQTFIVVG